MAAIFEAGPGEAQTLRYTSKKMPAPSFRFAPEAASAMATSEPSSTQDNKDSSQYVLVVDPTHGCHKLVAHDFAGWTQNSVSGSGSMLNQEYQVALRVAQVLISLSELLGICPQLSKTPSPA